MRKQILLVILVFIFSLLPLASVLAVSDYPSGTLLALKNVKDATVYIVGSDGKKYAFPDLKTYQTWYSNFDKVVKVDVKILDQYPNGGVVPYRAGIKLITHPDTARIYAVGPNGVVHWLASAEVAQSLYGANWQAMVQDVIPGYFSVSYTIGADISDRYPAGTLLQNGEKLYYVADTNIRPFVNKNAFFANLFSESSLVQIQDISKYTIGRTIVGRESILCDFVQYHFLY